MDDSLLDYLSGKYIERDIHYKYGYTFEQFLNSYNAGFMAGEINA